MRDGRENMSFYGFNSSFRIYRDDSVCVYVALLSCKFYSVMYFTLSLMKHLLSID